MKNAQKGLMMEINSSLKNAAVTVIQEQDMVRTVEIPNFQGMFVAPATDETIDVMHAFVEDDVRYVVGPRKK